MSNDTIAALATAPGRGGVAVIRISGPLVKHIALNLLGKLPAPRTAVFSTFRDESQQIIDNGITLFFPGPHSFTGEDTLELQGHGGPVIVDSLMQRLLSLGARLARPGEFSLRAFLNNKIDLAQAEAIADLIDASSTQAARSAIRSLQGEFSKKIHALVEMLIRLRMYVEAAIDFAEEEVDFLANKQIVIDLTAIIKQLEVIQNAAQQGSLLRDGLTAVIAGQPNAGKSSLLNRLSGKEIAIVTEIPGTTRDILREHILIDGMPMHILDTAGLRDSTDKVEKEGIRRAHDEIARADLILFVTDATSDFEPCEKFLTPHTTVITIRNKIDLTKEEPSIRTVAGKAIISLSAKQGDGIELLKSQIKESVGFQEVSDGVFSARRRHLDALARAEKCLKEGLQQLQHHRAGELLAEELRQAQLALSEVTGEFSSDDLLGKIFANFCIGK